MSHSILCVDPDDATRPETVATLDDGLDDLDVEVSTAETLDGATDAVGPGLSVLITEYDLPDGSGPDLIETTREVCPDATCILYTETDPDRFDVDALRGTITEYVGKDSMFGDDRLTDLVRNSLTLSPQTSYPTPQTEQERLAALRSYALDDPDLIASLDRVTDLAATHFDAPTASVNIIGEHDQELLACYGPAEEWGTVEREDTICTFTILEDANVMVVEDVAEDPRFASRSESLVGIGIRSYMGTSLVTPAGLSIGTLCVYDDEVRSFSPADEAYLQDLGHTVMDLIEAYARIPATGGEGVEG